MFIHDRPITISSAGSRRATRWPAQTLYWSELVEKLKTPVRGIESLAEYLRLPKARQDDLKDVGGFVAGVLAKERRKANAVLGRDVVTLDLDNIPPQGAEDALRRVEGLGCAYAVYSTRKHEPVKPRLRVLIPLSRTATADEYEPLARKLAAIIGIDLCDPSTFEASRLMYWPSCCKDSQYVYKYNDKPFVDVDGVLAMYSNWRNVSEWPQVPGTQQAHVKLAAKQGNPTDKTGIVGAFCRVYDIFRAMDVFLPGAYVPCDHMPGRYTFIGGSTTGGAVIYDDGAFIFSHHATDPAGGRLVNSFDLVRLHKFGEQDDDAAPNTPTNRLPSFTAMCELAASDAAVATLLNQERYEQATAEFTQEQEDTANWISKLAVSSTTGTPAKTTDNILIILENDPLLKGKLAFDEFANRGLALGSLPWDSRKERRQWTDIDDAGLRHYIERTYGITGKERIYDASALCAHKHTINDVRDYLTGLEWDGVRRLDSMLIDYLGAADTVYTRAVARKAFTAAVARAMAPGAKYDYMPILAGPQGIGKSTLLRLMGKRWYSDSLATFEGKDAAEMVQGTWINELGELNGLSRSETNAVKNFLSRTEDIYREPYGRRTGTYPRRCVFFGTTNDAEFLKDKTGNRRFWPVDVGLRAPTKSVFRDLPDDVDQLWAEAFLNWQMGEPLYLTGTAEEESKVQQEVHQETNIKEGLIREFVERPVPLGWERKSIGERRLYWSAEFGRGNVDTEPRTRICAVEVWCECLGGDVKYMKRLDAIDINGVLSDIPGWDKYRGRFGPYGPQKGFMKRLSC